MMTIDAISFLPAANPIQVEPLSTHASSSFEQWMTDHVGQVNDKLINAEQQVRLLAAGDVDNLHQVMISIEEARLSFQLAMQVRSRVLDAYQEVMRMQV